MAFYERFEWLCKEKGVTPTQAARDVGIRQSVVSMWKKRGSTPNGNTLTKIADYFGVTTDYLLGNVIDAKKPGSAIGINFAGPVTQPPTPHTILDDDPSAIYESGPVGYMARQELLKKAFYNLNGVGQLKAIECVLGLGKIKEYKRGYVFKPSRPSTEPKKGTDTTPSQDGSEGPQEDE